MGGEVKERGNQEAAIRRGIGGSPRRVGGEVRGRSNQETALPLEGLVDLLGEWEAKDGLEDQPHWEGDLWMAVMGERQPGGKRWPQEQPLVGEGGGLVDFLGEWEGPKGRDDNQETRRETREWLQENSGICKTKK